MNPSLVGAANGTIRVHHGYGRFEQEVPEGSPAARYRMRAPDSTRKDHEVWINMGAGGIGDTILGLCAVKGYKLTNPDKAVIYRFHERSLRFVMMFDGYDGIATHQFDATVNDFPPDWPDAQGGPCDARDMQLNAGYQLELRGKAQITRIERYCRNLGCVEPAMPVLRERARIERAGKDYQGGAVVVLAPWASTADRTYPLHGWLSIETALRELGYDTVVVGPTEGPVILGAGIETRPDGSVGPARVPVRTDLFKSRIALDAQPELLAGILLNAQCVVGNDSGPCHLAGILGTPTIVLCGWSVGEQVFGYYPKATCLQGKLACGGCWTQAPYYDHARCNRNCASLGTIDPAAVVREVLARVPLPAPLED